MDIFVKSPEEAMEAFSRFEAENEFACVSAVPTMAYQEIAKQFLVRAEPEMGTNLKDKVVVAYTGDKGAPKTVGELFAKFHIRDHENVRRLVDPLLIPAKRNFDGGWEQFVNTHSFKDSDYSDFGKVEKLLETKGIRFSGVMDDLIDQCPALNGYQPSVLTVITAKHKGDVDGLIYESLPNGLPGKGGELRVLGEPLLTSEKVQVHRIILIDQKSMTAYIAKVKQAFDKLFKNLDNKCSVLKSKLASHAPAEEIATRYLSLHQLDKAYKWALDCKNPTTRLELLKFIAAQWLEDGEIEKAKDLIFSFPDSKDNVNFLGQLVIQSLVFKNSTVPVDQILEEIPNGDQKNMILFQLREFSGDHEKYSPDPRYSMNIYDDYLLDLDLNEKMFFQMLKMKP